MGPISWSAKSVIDSTVNQHEIEFKRVVDRKNNIDEVAVYSDDRPIEFWRKLIGFREVTNA